MAVKTQKVSALPEGAIRLSREEALDLQKKFVAGWPVESEVFFLKHAAPLCGASTLVCGTIALNYFKNVFNVPSLLGVMSYGPSVIIPSIVSCMSTNRILTDKNLLMTMSCPLCIQLKFSAFQIYNSVLSPIVLSFLFCHMFGNHPKAFDSSGPPFKSKDFWKTALKLSEKGSTRFQLIAVFQVAFSFFLPYAQNMQLSNVIKKSEESNYDDELKNDFLV